ncbi:MAG: Panacea domain-containing protein [Rhodothermia bacterium]
MDRNERLLQVILERTPGKVSQTRLLKFVYMTDLVAWRVLGRPMSEFKYLRYNHGPFSPAFYTAKEGLLTSGLAEQEEISTRDGFDTTLIWSTVREPEEHNDFTPAELDIIDHVISRYRKKKLEEFLNEDVYQTAPMNNAKFGEELPMSAEKNKDRERFDGLSLDAILESRAAFERGEGIPFEQVRRDILESLE